MRTKEELSNICSFMGYEMKEISTPGNSLAIRRRSGIDCRPLTFVDTHDLERYLSRVHGYERAVRESELRDVNGIRLIDHREFIHWSAFSEPYKNVKDSTFMSIYHQEHRSCHCCGAYEGHQDEDGFIVRCEVHHMIGGSGRSDERCNLIMLCQSCHGTNRVTGGPIPLALAVWLKWRATPLECDWVQLARLNRAYLPDHIFDLQILDKQERNSKNGK